MMSNDEQTEEYEDIFYIFTLEEDCKDLKINDVKLHFLTYLVSSSSYNKFKLFLTTAIFCFVCSLFTFLFFTIFTF